MPPFYEKPLNKGFRLKKYIKKEMLEMFIVSKKQVSKLLIYRLQGKIEISDELLNNFYKLSAGQITLNSADKRKIKTLLNQVKIDLDRQNFAGANEHLGKCEKFFCKVL